MRIKGDGAATPRWLLPVILAGALIQGALYIWLMPPWQHYDEPGHFEYVWLVARHNRLPQDDESDPEMRRSMVASMIEHGFYDGLGYLPDLTVQDEPIAIGWAQLDEPPIYYLLASIPVRLVLAQNIDVQLYAARLASILLYVISILAAYGAVSEVVSAPNPLRWLVPITLVFLPGYADLMTAVNNDVAAIAGFSLFIWAGTRVICRGLSLLNGLGLVLAATFCGLSKETAYLAVPLGVLALVLAISRGKKWQVGLWGLGAVAVLAAVIAAMGWGDAAKWYRGTDQPSGTQALRSDAPLGKHAFGLDVLPSTASFVQLAQLVSPDDLADLQGKPVTLGAWMWADVPGQYTFPVLRATHQDQSISQMEQHAVSLSSEPTFYAFAASVPADTALLQVIVIARSGEDDAQGSLYLDGLVLAEGEYATSEAPAWESDSAVTGSWGGAAVVNVLRNASAERAGPYVRPWVDRLSARVMPDQGRASMGLYSLLDLDGTDWYYRSTAQTMLRTFWGLFGWGHVALLGSKPYRVLAAVTIAGALGALLIFFKSKPRTWQWNAMILWVVSLGLVWGVAVLRGTVYLFHWPFIPGARYAYPAIIPTIGMLCLGWVSILNLLAGWLKVPPKAWAILYVVMLLTLNGLAIASILGYYHS